MTWAMLFFSGVVVDALWAYYTWCVSRGAPTGAALASAGTGMLGVLGVSQAVKDPSNIIPYAIGLAVGTWVIVAFFCQYDDGGDEDE